MIQWIKIDHLGWKVWNISRLFALVQQLLVTQPNHLSSTTFANLVKMIHTMTKLCPDLAATLIQLDYHVRISMVSEKLTKGKSILKMKKNQFKSDLDIFNFSWNILCWYRNLGGRKWREKEWEFLRSVSPFRVLFLDFLIH